MNRRDNRAENNTNQEPGSYERFAIDTRGPRERFAQKAFLDIVTEFSKELSPIPEDPIYRGLKRKLDPWDKIYNQIRITAQRNHQVKDGDEINDTVLESIDTEVSDLISTCHEVRDLLEQAIYQNARLRREKYEPHPIPEYTISPDKITSILRLMLTSPSAAKIQAQGLVDKETKV